MRRVLEAGPLFHFPFFGRRPITWAERERERERRVVSFSSPSSTPPRTIDNEVRLRLMVPGEAHNVIYVVCVGPRFHVISFRLECLVELVES